MAKRKPLTKLEQVLAKSFIRGLGQVPSVQLIAAKWARQTARQVLKIKIKEL